MRLSAEKKTRRERLKSAPYPRLKKRKVFKIVEGRLFGLFENPVCCKISKKQRSDLSETLKNFEFSKFSKKKRKMRILNSLIVPKNVKGGHLGFFNIHSGAKHQQNFGNFAFFNIHSVAKHQTSRERPKSAPYLRLKIVKSGTLRALWNSSWLQIMKKNSKGGPFWVLHFKVEAFGCVQNQLLRIFHKKWYIRDV